MSDTETGFAAVVPPIPEHELQAAHEPAPEPETEPTLDKLIRFEAGTVHELLEHVKEWVEWRLANGAPPAKPDVPAVANDVASTDHPAA